MKRFFIITGITVLSILLTSCSKYKDITCKAFSLTQESYWFPNLVGDSIIFINNLNVKKKYIITSKEISHTTSYTDNSGCSCLDISGMILVCNTDSIWFNCGNDYYDKDATKKTIELVAFVFSNILSEFNDINKTTDESLTIDTITFNNVKKFELNLTNNLNVKTVYMIKDLGIIRFIMADGEVWTNTNLTNYNPTNQSSFKYVESNCE